MLINVRGAHGAGKSWVVRQIMQRFPVQSTELAGENSRLASIKVGKPVGYWLGTPKPTLVVGRYETAGTGGCDTIKDYTDIDIILEEHRRHGHVLFEGIRVNATYGRWIELSKKLGEPIVAVILNTSVEECMKNIIARREVAGTTRPIDKVRASVEDQHHRTLRAAVLWGDARLPFHKVSSVEAVELITGWLK
jgi:hypothetical protein